MKWYVEYWDDVVRQWFEGSNQLISPKGTKIGMIANHMPEPYWGNPNQCSIVIANYNPGGVDRNRHTYIKCTSWKNTFVNEVKKKGYSKVVSDFPIFCDRESDEKFNNTGKEFEWWEDYKGKRWWQHKKKWLNDEIGPAFPDYRISPNKPFAIEFWAWHSKNWPGNGCLSLYKEDEMRGFIDKYFIKAFIEAVHNSDTKIGLCIGSQFFHLFEKMKECNGNYIQRIDDGNFPKCLSCKIHLFRIRGENIVVLWGKGKNRYPKNIRKDLNVFIQKYLGKK